MQGRSGNSGRAEAAARLARRYDLRGLKCPLPVLKTRKRLRAIDKGDFLWIETTDPLATIDIPHFCAEDGHHLVESEPLAGGGHRFLIRKGGA